jgi:transcriptional regulator with XRE-family HTH domain
MVDLGKRLKELRIQNNMTQQQVADRIWVSKAMISSYELATRTPSYEVLIKLSKLFGVSTDYLLGVDRERTINISSLNEKQIKLIVDLIEEMTKNNN